MTTPLLTVRDLAQALNTSERSIYRLVSQRALPYVRLGGRHRGRLRFDLDEVRAALSHPVEAGRAS